MRPYTISSPTTRFNDGRIATIERGFAWVAKGKLEVLLTTEVPESPDKAVGYPEPPGSPRCWEEGLEIFKNGPCQRQRKRDCYRRTQRVALCVRFDKGIGCAAQGWPPLSACPTSGQ